MVTDISYDQDLQPVVDSFTSLYAKTDEKHVPANCDVDSADLLNRRGYRSWPYFSILAQNTPEPMGAVVNTAEGAPPQPLHMGSYGIGVSRLVGGIIEARHDERYHLACLGLLPFDVGIINLKSEHEKTDPVCEQIFQGLCDAGLDPLLDDSS